MVSCLYPGDAGYVCESGTGVYNGESTTWDELANDTYSCDCTCDYAVDCDNICGGSTIVDNCGLCGGDEFDCTNPANECSCAEYGFYSL